MHHQPLVDALRDAAERSKGLDIELAYNSAQAVVVGRAVTTQAVTIAGPAGNAFLCLSSVVEHLRPLGDPHAIAVDLFGPPHNEVVIGGRVGGTVSEVKIKL